MNSTPIIYFFQNAKKDTIPNDFRFRFGKEKKFREGPGPGKNHGLLAAPFPVSGFDPLEFDTETHDWHKVKEAWIGIKKGIRPEDVQRPEITGGHWVELGDKKLWLIPAAMLDAPNFSLPRYETVDENGNWVWRTAEEYEHLSIIAANFWEAVDSHGKFDLDEDIVRENCCTALAVNYNLTNIEMGLMKLFTHEAYQRIIKALIDFEGQQQILSHLEGKKKLSEDGNTNSGKPDSSETINQHTET